MMQKEKLLSIANGQKQIIQSSVVIAVLGDLEANKNTEIVYDAAVEAGLIPNEVRDRLAAQIADYYQDPQFARDSAFSNAGLFAMQLMLTAKALGYDTCPMVGYNQEQFVKSFNVPARYAPVMLICVGLAAKAGRPSNRLPLGQFAVFNPF
ncbi:nitroreductase family protein [Cohnella cellulosilytica]